MAERYNYTQSWRWRSERGTKGESLGFIPWSRDRRWC